MNVPPFISQWSFDVPDVSIWRDKLSDVITVLQQTSGFQKLMVFHSPDEIERYIVQCEWNEVGSYRRGISSTPAKMTIWPFLSSMLDQPSAFETLLIATESEQNVFDSSVEN